MLLPAKAQEAADSVAEEYIDRNQAVIDSILSLITPITPDSIKAKYYNNIASWASNNNDTIIKYANMSISFCKETDYYLLGYNNMFLYGAYRMEGDYKAALQSVRSCIKYFNKSGNLKDLAWAYNSASIVHAELNNFDSIGFYMNKALKIGNQLGDTTFIAHCYQILGLAYYNCGFYNEAKNNYKKAIFLDSLVGNLEGYATDLNWLVTSILERKPDSITEYFAAKDYMIQAVNILDTINNNIDIYDAYWTLSSVYINLAQKTDNQIYADSCLYFFKKAKPYFQAYGGIDNYRMLRYDYVDYLLFYKRYDESVNMMRELEKTLDDKTPTMDLEDFHKKFRDVYLKLGDYKNAFFHSEKANEYTRIYLNDSTMSVLSNIKAQQAVIKEQLEREKAEELHRMERRTMLAVIIALLIVSVLIFRVFWLKHKSNQQLAEKNHILHQQKTEIEAQRDEIESQRNEIVSSVNYAKRIQRAAVSAEADVHGLFPESFVFYHPRDIVSGDYYRCGKCGRYSVMITADCTGHGIPGAFLSMLGLSALKEFCVSEYDAANPGTILDRMRNFIKTTLITDSDGKELKDGMDMTICSFDFENMELRYAIAEQTAVIVRGGEVIKLKGDRMPVGRHLVEKEHFQTLTQSLEKGDMVYMFSDGIQDQFGGTDSRKFSSKQLVATLKSLADKPAEKQCQLLEQIISDWRGDTPQLDDMTMVGIRV